MDPGRSEPTNQKESPDRHAPERESPEPVGEDWSTLLESLGGTTLVAVAVDPQVVHCQWKVAPSDLEDTKRALEVGEGEFWPVLRFYDVTNGDPERAAASPSFAVEVQLRAENWYVRSCGPGRTYRAELALTREDGSFAVIASSDRVQTPPSAPSNDADEHWPPIRMGLREPERATPVFPPINLAFEPTLGEPSEPGEPAVRLPIDMREEVRKLLTALYSGLEEESVPVGGLILTEERRIKRIFHESAALLPGMKSGEPVDLTELNERSFASGVSSRTK